MTFAIVLAGGNGSRMNSTTTKQRMTVCGHSVIWHAVRAFERCDDVDKVIVVAKDGEQDFMRFELLEFSKIFNIVTGGKTRAESSYKGLLSVPEDCTMVAIHDAARCLITPCEISRIINKARAFGAATAATRVTDTIKRVDREGIVIDTLDRDELCRAQTPQAFNYRGIVEAFASIDPLDARYTDDNMIYERSCGRVYTVDVGADNIKITESRDILLAGLILKERENV